MFETGSDNGWVLSRMAQVDPHPMAHPMSLDIYNRLPNDTDFTVFRKLGIQGLNFAAIGGAEVYHQPTDQVHRVSEGTLQHHGARLLALTQEFGHQGLSQVEDEDRAPLVVPGVGLVPVPLSWIPLLTLILSLVWVILIAVSWRSPRGWLWPWWPSRLEYGTWRERACLGPGAPSGQGP